MEKIKRTEKVTNEDVLKWVEEERNLVKAIEEKRQDIWTFVA